MAWASVGGGATTTGGPTPLSRSGPVLRFVLPRQRFVPRSHGTEKAPAICWPGQVKQSGIGGYSALPALHQLRRDCRAERFLVALTPAGDLFICAKDLLLWSQAQPADGVPGANSFSFSPSLGDCPGAPNNRWPWAARFRGAD